MGTKLTDKQKKKIIADYVECQNYSEVSRKYGIHHTTVKRIVDADSGFSKKAQQKKEETTRSILEYMDLKKDMVCNFIDLYMQQLTDPQKLEKAKLSELSTAFGTVIDKFTKVETSSFNKPTTDVEDLTIIADMINKKGQKHDNKD